MKTFEYKNFRYDVDSTDFAFVEKFETLQEELVKKLNAQPEDEKLSVKIRYVAECYFEFFEKLFGEGTCNAMFGPSVNIRECDDAYITLIDDIRKDNISYETENKNKIAQLNGNRATRRKTK